MNRPMNHPLALVTVLIVVGLAAGAAASAASLEEAATGGKEAFVCPPCGDAHDKTIYDQPGACPVCGMRLVKKSGLAERRNVAILLFDGVQIIDYTGPYEVFGQGGIFDVYTVSETGATLKTAMGMSVNPAHGFATVPKPDILIVPGGDVTGPVGSAATVDWIRGVEKEASYVMSVCNGAFILAKAGLLEGKAATTFYGLIEDLKKQAPNTKVVSDQRWVDNGKVITSAGLSSGIDASLHLISKIRGQARARATALHLEYDWDPDSDFARAALADRKFPDFAPPDGATVELVSTEGTREEWTTKYEVRSTLSSAQLAGEIRSGVRRDGLWREAPRQASGGGLESVWTRVDDEGAAWEFTAVVEGSAAESGPRIVTLHIEKGPKETSEARSATP